MLRGWKALCQDAFSLTLRSGEAEGDSEGTRCSSREQNLTRQIFLNPHPHNPELGPSPPPLAAHDPPSQQAGLCTPPSHPQGEPGGWLPPDAAERNAGARTFPETSPDLLQPIGSDLLPKRPTSSHHPSNQAPKSTRRRGGSFRF